MTVPSLSYKVSYPGNGTTGPYTVPFRWLQDADLAVYLLPQGALVATTLVLNVGYFCTGAGQYTGGTILLAASIPSTTSITIFRNPVLLQNTSLQTQGAYQAVSVETGLDLLTMDLQAANDALSRSLVVSPTDGAITPIPPASVRAGTLLGFDAMGNPIASTFASTSVPSTSLLQLLDTIPLLRTVVPPPALQTYLVRGGAVAGDGGGGFYRWNAADTTADNGSTVIAPNAGGTGRWNILVSLAKLTISSASGIVIGRGTAGTGGVEELVPNGLTITPNSISNDAQFNIGKNKLINGAFDLWQAGGTFNTSGVYTADRCRMTFTGTASTLTRQLRVPGILNRPGLYFMRLVNAVGTTTATIAQRIENVGNFAGGNICISLTGLAGAARALTISVTQNFGVGGSPSSSVTTSIGTINLTNSLARTFVTAAVPSIAGKTLGTFATSYIEVTVTFPTSTAETYDIYDMQAERGSVMTDYEQTSIGLTTTMCQRYRTKTFLIDGDPVSAFQSSVAPVWAQVVGASSVQSGFWWPYPVRMCTPNSVTVFTYNPVTAVNFNPRGSSADWTGISTIQNSELGVAFVATSPAGSAAGNIISLHFFIEREL